MGESIEIQWGKVLWDPTVIYHVPPPKAREMSVKIVQAQTSNVTAGVNVCRTPVVRPRRGKVVVLVVLVVGAVRSNSGNCPKIHFQCFTDPLEIQIPKAHDAYYSMMAS